MLQWQVHAAGYEMVERPLEGGEVVRALQPKALVPVRGYVLGPEHAGLFRQFATLKQSPEAIVEFANQYGLLWQENADFELLERQWLVPIAEVRALVSTYDLAMTTDDDAKRTECFEQIWALFNTGRIHPRFKLEMHPHDDQRIPNKCWTEPVPENLIGAILLQVADQVSQGTRFKRCENCPKWLRVGPGSRRKATTRFCSTRCRVAWNRRHKGGSDAR